MPLRRMTPVRLGVAVGLFGIMVAVAGCGFTKGRAQKGGASKELNTSCVENLPLDGKPLCSSARAAMIEVNHSDWISTLDVAFASPVPVYLPTWSPSPLNGMCVSYGGDAGPSFYEVEAEAEPCQSAVQASGAAQGASAGMYVWRVTGGFPPYPDEAPSLVVGAGRGQTVRLGHGIDAELFRQGAETVLRWNTGGWKYEVIGQSGSGSDGALSKGADRIISAVGRSATPMSGEPTGSVVELRQNGETLIWVSWTEGSVEYSAEGPDTSVFALAASLVKVPIGGCGGGPC